MQSGTAGQPVSLQATFHARPAQVKAGQGMSWQSRAEQSGTEHGMAGMAGCYEGLFLEAVAST